MRKGTLFFLSFFLVLSTNYAQVWLEAGPKASFGPSGYFNSVLAADNNHDYSLNLAYNFGIAAGLNIGDLHGFNVEGMTGTYFQDVLFHDAAGDTKRNALEWEVLDLYTVYRFYPESGMYIELGPKFTKIKNIKQREGVAEVPVEGKYEESYISGVLGVGAFLSGSKIMVIKSGLRFEYGLTDFVSADGIASGFPSYASGLADPGKTVPFRVSFGLEISFGIGGIAQASCGRRGFMLGGSYR